MPGAMNIPPNVLSGIFKGQEQAMSASKGALSAAPTNPSFGNYENELKNPTRSQSGFRNNYEINAKTGDAAAVDKYVSHFFVENSGTSAPSLAELQQVQRELGSRNAFAKDAMGKDYDEADYDLYEGGKRTGYISGGQLREFLPSAISSAEAALAPKEDPVAAATTQAVKAPVEEPNTLGTKRMSKSVTQSKSAFGDLLGSNKGRSLLGE